MENLKKYERSITSSATITRETFVNENGEFVRVMYITIPQKTAILYISTPKDTAYVVNTSDTIQEQVEYIKDSLPGLIGGINASFFKIKSNKKPVGLCIKNKKLVSRFPSQKPIICQLEDGSVLIGSGRLYEKHKNQIYSAVAGSNLVLEDGKYKKYHNLYLNQKHPRSCVGIKPNGDLVLLMVYGRQKDSVGCTLKELSEIMFIIGCKDALNLDGGGSSCFSFRLSDPQKIYFENATKGKFRKIPNCLLVIDKGKQHE